MNWAYGVTYEKDGKEKNKLFKGEHAEREARDFLEARRRNEPRLRSVLYRFKPKNYLHLLWEAKIKWIDWEIPLNFLWIAIILYFLKGIVWVQIRASG